MFFPDCRVVIDFFGPSAVPEMSLKNNLLENTAAITKDISLVYVFITFFDFLCIGSDTIIK